MNQFNQYQHESDGHETDSDFNSICNFLEANGFTNTSYHNDIAPSFERGDYKVFIFRKDLDDREDSEINTTRFLVFNHVYGFDVLKTDELWEGESKVTRMIERDRAR